MVSSVPVDAWMTAATAPTPAMTPVSSIRPPTRPPTAPRIAERSPGSMALMKSSAEFVASRMAVVKGSRAIVRLTNSSPIPLSASPTPGRVERTESRKPVNLSMPERAAAQLSKRPVELISHDTNSRANGRKASVRLANPPTMFSTAMRIPGV